MDMNARIDGRRARGIALGVGFALAAGAMGLAGDALAAPKPGPEEALALLKAGNERFVAGEAAHGHTDAARLIQAGRESQGDHAYATVIACSDSRVPVERIFDAGIMDIFVVRVAGNVCDTDEIGSIEYGLCHVHTPVLVVLGHTQCGAVTAVTRALNGEGHALERNIPPLIDNIEPAVRAAMAAHPEAHGDAVIPHAIEQNVWQGIEDLFRESPATRALVKAEAAAVVGAIYDVSTGEVAWLPEARSRAILAEVERDPKRAKEPMAKAHADDEHAAAPGDGHAPAHAATGALRCGCGD